MNWLLDFIGKLLKAAADWVDRCLPKYEPGVWNDDFEVQSNNNCYNYGCDIQTNTYAQPGAAHGIFLTQADMNCTAVTDGAIADGLVPVDCDEGCGCAECRHQVALVISPTKPDYHWYRKDRDGNWTHKMAWTPATNLDDSGNIITDPRTADRGSYTIFCGCFCVNKKTVVIV
jgi:hypothetical protein